MQQPIFSEAARMLAQGIPFVLATVVRTKGSTPQKPGAKLLVRKDGTAVGTLGGGCIEADVWAEAKGILDDGGKAQVRRFVLNEDIAARDGLVCGGNMEILIDPVTAPADLKSLMEEILAAYRGEGDCALVTVVTSKHGAKPGTKLFIRANGSTVGTLGTPALEQEAIKLAQELMPKGREQWVETPYAKYYIESFTNPATVVIAGGGHVGKAVYNVATMLGFKVIIVDDRRMYANIERFPQAEKVVVNDFDKGLESLNLGPNHYVLISTRGHKLDGEALLAAARSRAGYLGLLGSRRKAILIYRDLLRAGVSEERIREVHSPVGLDLGGRTPEEIAVSIMAEILAVKHDRQGGFMTMDEKVIEKARALAVKSTKRAIAAAV